jgi:hypothetical protein
VAHNNSRSNYFAIADEGFFGYPNTTGTGSKYGGHHGSTLPPVDVLIGDARSVYINTAIRNELQDRHNLEELYYVDCPSTAGGAAGSDTDGDSIDDDGDGSGTVGDNPCTVGNTNCDDNCVNTSNTDQANSDSDAYGDVCDCQELLTTAANSPGDMRIAGLFERPCEGEEFPGCYTDNPTLSESVSASLQLLGDTAKYPNGAVFMFEGGAVDWAGHANDMEWLITEMRDFNDAVDTAINWVEDDTNDSDWNNTLLIVTGDHECGYLTQKKNVFPDQPLGVVDDDTVRVTGSCATDKKGEKVDLGTGRRASWEDLDCDDFIDTNETVYWQWNSGGHSNSLIPLYCRGVGCDLFSNYYEPTPDLKRGDYLDNSDVWTVMNTVLIDVPLLSAPTVTNIDTTSATLGATIDYDGESAISERGTVWDVSSPPVAFPDIEGGTSEGVFSHSRTGLYEGSLTYYRGYAENAAGTGYSDEDSFYTEPLQASNVTISSISDTSMQINWTNISSNSPMATVLMKADTSVDSAPVDGNPYVADSAFGSGEQLGAGNYVVFSGAGSQVDVTGLSPWTTYHVAVYAYAGSGAMTNYQQDSPAVSSRGSCTDNDGDTYAIEGGGCGPVDCDDGEATERQRQRMTE